MKNQKNVKDEQKKKELKVLQENIGTIAEAQITGLDERLYFLRKKFGLSQEKVAEYLGIERATYLHKQALFDNDLSHKIRFYCASTAYDGNNIATISKLMGHSQVATTIHYLRNVDKGNDSIEAFEHLGLC